MSNLNVIILASGKSSRLEEITNYIPKCLVNIGNKTALGQQIDYWSFYVPRHIYVVVHSKFKTLVEGYLTANDYDNIIVLTEDEQLGSAHAIANVLNTAPEIIGSNVILNWGDIIPVTPVNITFTRNKVYTYGDSCRYNATDNEITKCIESNGNVIGIYCIANITPFKFKLGKDFISIIKTKQFIVEDIDSIIDFGDRDKHIDSCKDLQISREFNSVHMYDEIVIKKALNDKGKKLQVDELEWYSKIESDLIPKILNVSSNQFSMQRLKGTPLFQAEKSNVLIYAALNQITNLQESIQGIKVDNSVVINDIKKECIDKLDHRYKVIEQMIQGFPKINSVNGVELRSHSEVANILFHKIRQINRDTTSYSFIHGDCNYSNTFYTEDGIIKFIDPRGYFGHTKLYGLQSYDYAKMLYACSGYDQYNADVKFHMPIISDGNIQLDIKAYDKDFLDLDHLFSEECYYWLPIIWMNLGGYFKNNPVKAVCAYYYGLYLAEIVLKKYNTNYRTLIDGTQVGTLDEPITASIITKCPSKWILQDMETGVKYTPSGSSDIGKMWTKKCGQK